AAVHRRGMDVGARVGGQLERDRAVHARVAEASRPVGAAEPGEDRTVDRLAMDDTATRGAHAAVHGRRLDVAAQVLGRDRAVYGTSSEIDALRDANPEIHLDVVVVGAQVPALARLAAVAASPARRWVDGAQRHATRVLDELDLDLVR